MSTNVRYIDINQYMRTTKIMKDFFYIFIALACSALMACILYSWILRHAYAKDFNVLGLNQYERKAKVSQLGGLIYIPCVIVGICLSMVLMSREAGAASSIKISTMLLGGGVMSVYLIGLLKDLYGLPVWAHFFIQTLAALTLPLCGLLLSNFAGFLGIEEISLWLSYPLTVLIIVSVVNAIKILDDIDGLLPFYSILCMLCFCLCFYDSYNMVYCLISGSMIGALVVFFYYNMFGTLKYKSKINMGNSGSLTIGFSLAYLSLKFIIAESTSSYHVPERILICVSLFFLPCVDLIRVFFERILHGDIPFQTDQRHIHHLLIQAGIYGRITLLVMLSVIMLFLLVNGFMASVDCPLTWIVLLDILLYTILVAVVKHRVRIFSRRIALFDNIQERFYCNAKLAKKICILTPRFPVPENGGDVLRINNIARQLKRQGYQLVLVSFEDDRAPHIYDAERIYDKVYTVYRGKIYSLWQSLIHLLSGCAMQCGYYYSGKYKRMLKYVIETEKPDLFIAHLLRMMPYLDELQLHDRSIIEMTDALSKTYSLSSDSKGGGLLKYIYCIERHLISRAEQYSMLYFPVNVLVSQADAGYLGTLSTHVSHLRVHSNGVDMIEKPSVQYNPNKIVFVGNMRTLQNQDAVLFFVQEVFPRILSRQPDTIFYIVGAQPPQKIIDLTCKNIVVTGFVDDLHSIISDAAVAVAPVRVAAGIQNKVLVAMGSGIPVVLTTIISHAIPELEDEKNCIIRDEAPTIAEACLYLIKHPEYRAFIAREGYDMVKQHYGWEEKLRGYVVEK